MKIYIDSEHICTHSEREQVQYGNWSEEYSFDIKEVSTSPFKNSNEYFNLSVNKGDKVYVLILRYSEGDSFGTATGKGEVIWAFTEEEFAERVYHEYMNNSEEDSIFLMLEVEGKKFKRTKIGNIVSGYFENLISLDIEEHIVC